MPPLVRRPVLLPALSAGVVPLLNAEYHQHCYKLKSDGTPAFARRELDGKF